MAAQDGIDVLLKVSNSDSPETFATVGGMNTNAIQLNEETVDVTSKDDVSRWMQRARFGFRSAALSGSGIFKDSAAEELVRANYYDTSAILNWQLVVPDFGTFEGQFIITQLEYAGERGGAVTYSLSLESAGSITFTAA